MNTGSQITSGYGDGSEILRLTVNGAKVCAEKVWCSGDLDDLHGGVILLDGWLHGVGGTLVNDKPPRNPGILSAWEVASGAKLGVIQFFYPVSGLDLSSDGTFLAVGAGVLYLLDIAVADGRVGFKASRLTLLTGPSSSIAPRTRRSTA